MTITETSSGFEIKFTFDPYKVKAVKGIEGARFNGSSKAWYVPKHRTREEKRKGFSTFDKNFTVVLGHHCPASENWSPNLSKYITGFTGFNSIKGFSGFTKEYQMTYKDNQFLPEP